MTTWLTGIDSADGGRGRAVVWAGAVALFLVPVTAKLLIPSMLWDETDFIFAAVLIFGSAGVYHLLSRQPGGIAYRGGAALALAAIFLLLWLNGAVGIIGSENNPANLMFVGVIAIAIGGSFIARFRAAGMARAMTAAAAAEALIPLVELVARFGAAESPIWPREVIVLSLFFTTLWLGSAWLFRRAAERAMRDG